MKHTYLFVPGVMEVTVSTMAAGKTNMDVRIRL